MEVRPDRELVLMQIAQIVAQRSTCSRAHVGAVIAHEGRILVTGYNGAPAGMPHCNHTIVNMENGATPRSGCSISIHAEANAIAWAARHGIMINGADLFTTMAPCLSCAQLLINTGIQKVYFKEAYRQTEGVDLLLEAGISVGVFQG